MMTAFDRFFMQMALREAEKAAADGEVPTGCVIVEPAPLTGGGERQHLRVGRRILQHLRLVVRPCENPRRRRIRIKRSLAPVRERRWLHDHAARGYLAVRRRFLGLAERHLHKKSIELAHL